MNDTTKKALEKMQVIKKIVNASSLHPPSYHLRM